MIEPKTGAERLGGMEATFAGSNTGQVQMETSVRISAIDFDTFYASSYSDVARALSVTLGDEGWGREAADEAMTRAYDRWSDISRYENPSGWVYRVGLNWARSWFRKLDRRLPKRDEAASLPPTKDHALDVAIQNLDIKYRSVVVCRYLLDWSTAETARALDIAPGTVKSRLSTGLSHLRSQLDTPQQGSDSQ